jgi:norsolorinic acid ketoreductase
VAAVRNPEDTTSASLPSLAKASGNAVVLVKLDAVADYAALASSLAANDVHSLDVVIANAGTASAWNTVLKTQLDEVAYDMQVNSVAPVRLLQTVWPLLQKGTQRKIVFMTSTLGSISELDKASYPGLAYGMSKAALNFFMKKASVELKDEGLVTGVIHPG